jgi:hypothetical protein
MRISGRLLQPVRNVGEGQVEAAAYGGGSDNDYDRNAGRDQGVFDGGGAILVAQESFEKFHSSSPDGFASIIRRVLSNEEVLILAFNQNDDFPECRPPDMSFSLRIRDRQKRERPRTSRGLSYLERSKRLFKRVGNVGEGRIELRTDTLDDRDNRDGNASGDQAVFDGSRARFVVHETSEGLHV